MYLVFLFVFELLVLYFLARKLTRRIWVILYKLTTSKKWATYIYSFLFLPGIIFHELAHFITALFLLVPVGKISLGPVFNEDSTGNLKEIKLGSVNVAKTDVLRGTLIGFAPFIYGVAIILLVINFIYTKNLLTNWIVVVALYLIFEIGNTMFLSRSDVKSALVLVLIVLLFYLTLYVFGVRLSFNPEGLLTQSLVNIFSTAVKFLLVPLGVDLILLGLSKIIRTSIY